MEKLIEKLYKLVDKLYMGDFPATYSGEFEQGFIEGLHTVEDELRAILTEYELEKHNEHHFGYVPFDN